MYKILNNILEMDDYSLQRLSKSSKLPSEYQQIEYIESTGTQYIDTGIKTNTTTSRYETKINPSLVSGTIGIFGTRNSSSANQGSMNVFIIDRAFRLDWLSGNISSAPRISSNTEYTISITRGLATINNVNYTSGDRTSIDGSYTFYVGSFNNAGSVYSNGFSGKIYYSKLYNNNILVFDGVPCYRKSDNKIGLYDLVSNTFFTNAGTGEFTYGSTSLALSTPFGDKGIEDRTNDLSFTDFNNWESEQYDINENKDIEEIEQIKAPNILSDTYTSITADTEVQPNQVDFIPKAIEEIKANQPNAEQIVDNDEE